jgi:hypothetical protein
VFAVRSNTFHTAFTLVHQRGVMNCMRCAFVHTDALCRVLLGNCDDTASSTATFDPILALHANSQYACAYVICNYGKNVLRALVHLMAVMPIDVRTAPAGNLWAGVS